MTAKSFEDLIGDKQAIKAKADKNYSGLRQSFIAMRSKRSDAMKFTKGDYNVIYSSIVSGFAVLMLERDLLIEADRINRELIAKLEQRLTQVEEKGLRYRGVFQKAEEYHRGDAVTANGSLFVCVGEAVKQAPPADCWQLAVKRGSDGRNAA